MFSGLRKEREREREGVVHNEKKTKLLQIYKYIFVFCRMSNRLTDQIFIKKTVYLQQQPRKSNST